VREGCVQRIPNTVDENTITFWPWDARAPIALSIGTLAMCDSSRVSNFLAIGLIL